MEVSRFCLACMSYGQPRKGDEWARYDEQSRSYIQRALEMGINFFDTAHVYSAGMSDLVAGHAVGIATKVNFPTGTGPIVADNSGINALGHKFCPF